MEQIGCTHMEKTILKIKPKRYTGESTIVSMQMPRDMVREKDRAYGAVFWIFLNHMIIVRKEIKDKGWNSMAVIKCKMCGGDLNIVEGSTVAECEYCGSRQTVPNRDNEKKLSLFARADRLRRTCEFDKAAGVYESIVADFPAEAEAYWGLVLCRYGIEYVDDPATGTKIPTCHRSSFDSILEDGDFEQATENADAVARKVYREEAKAIEIIRRGILEISGKEEPYDIFICHQETGENGQRTLDNVLAQNVYTKLQ